MRFSKPMIQLFSQGTDGQGLDKQNIAMTAPIMSRFDLSFILVDDCNEVNDYAIDCRIVDLIKTLDPDAPANEDDNDDFSGKHNGRASRASRYSKKS